MLEGLMMDYQLTLDKIIEHASRLHPNKKVISKLPDGSFHELTYGAMHKRIRRLSSALEHQLGVKPGDRIGTFAWNNYQHLELYFAIPGAAAVCHTLNLRLNGEQLSYIIDHAEDKVVFVDGSLLPLYEQLAADSTSVQAHVLFNVDRDVKTTLKNIHFYEDLIDNGDENYSWACTDERMASAMCYTSGTTGNPKGALYSHRSTYLHTFGVMQANAMGLCERDTVLAVVPQFHAMSWGLPYACVYSGANLLMPGQFLQAEPLAEMTEKYKVTVAAGVPTIWNGLYHELKKNPRDISTIRALVVGGSAMPRALTRAYEEELGVDVMHAWGMTEMSPIGTVSSLMSHHAGLSAEEKWDVKATQGYQVAGVEMRICDEDGDELPWDGKQMGELQVRGFWISKQYFKIEPSLDHFTADGWFRTGDVATMSPDGYMRITDRTKDLVKSGGEWISSVDLENALIGHANVMEAAVFAVPDQRWAERPWAAITPAEGATVDVDALNAYLLKEGFAKFWLPDNYVQIDALPKTSTGKLDKKVLRKMHADGEI
ncbi:MAG: acyl-CoA synthetase (AMP-forming)/AMP-acid ligase II [Cellvibrionaceae bacterium]|jgi:acyl-CoA synthetase (AMP-forming)/AMP-acid ligase II